MPDIDDDNDNTSGTKSQESRSQPKVLCQLVSKDLNKTQQGKIFSHDLKDIYALMIIYLNLTPDGGGGNGTKFLGLSKTHPYTFTINAALLKLLNLQYSIDSSLSSISLCYNINQDIGISILNKFLVAKLIHFPNDRTRSTFKPSTVLQMQPTPKGVAFVARFIEQRGVKMDKLPPILSSNLNSMQLFEFDRNYLNDKINYSSHLMKLLFMTMLGESPNVWYPNNKPDLFTVANLKGIIDSRGLAAITSFDINPEDQDRLLQSPFHHRYFTNPESDSHVQYYVSNTGIRISPNPSFSYRIMTGKSIVQWLMDCTDLLSTKQAIEIGNLFLRLQFLTYASEPNSDGCFDDLNKAIYTLTPISRSFVSWYRKPSKQSLNNDIIRQSLQYKLDDFLKDSGLRKIFKLHLNNEFCSENLDAFMQLRLFNRKFTLLNKLINVIGRSDGYSEQLLKMARDCLSLAYNIYFTFLSSDASLVLNIDYLLRNAITKILIDNDDLDDIRNYNNLTTPIMTNFPETSNHNQEVDSQETSAEDDDNFSIFEDSRKSSNFSGQKDSGGSICSSISFDKELHDIYLPLQRFAPISIEIMGNIYRLMEEDSFPKFINSQLFNDYKQIID